MKLKRRAIFLVIGISSFMSSLDGAITSIIVPVIQRDFSTTIVAVQWVSLAFLVTISGLLPVFGRLADMWGYRRVYLSGIFIFTFSSFLCSLSPTVGWLIGSRIFQAVGSSMVISVAPAILTMNFPSERRGRVLGMQLTLTYLGLITGPPLGGYVTYLWHWRAAFWINVPIGIMLLIATLLIVPRTDAGQKERFDFIGAVLMFTGITALLLGITAGGGKTTPHIYLVLFSMLLGFIFVRRELRLENREEPCLLRMSLFKIRTFSLSAGVSLTGYTCEFFMSFLIPFYLMRVLGLSTGVAGLLLTAKSIVMVFVAPFAGSLSDRLGPRPLSLTSMGSYIVSLLLQSRLTGESSVIWIAVLLMFTGIATGLFVSPNNSAMLGAAPQSSQGVASSILGLMRNLGMSFGVALSGALLTFRPDGILAGFRFAMACGAMLAAIGFALALMQERPSSAMTEEGMAT